MNFAIAGITGNDDIAKMSFVIRSATDQAKQAVTPEQAPATSESSEQSTPIASPATTTTALPAAPAPVYDTSVSGNMIASLFVHTTEEKSKYLEATSTAFTINNKVKNNARQQSVSLLDQLKAYSELSNSKPYGFEESEYLQAGKDKRKAEQLAEQDQLTKTLHSHEELLEEFRDDIDTAADEALAPETSGNASAQGSNDSNITAPATSDSSSGQDAVASTPTPSIDIVV